MAQPLRRSSLPFGLVAILVTGSCWGPACAARVRANAAAPETSRWLELQTVVGNENPPPIETIDGSGTEDCGFLQRVISCGITGASAEENCRNYCTTERVGKELRHFRCEFRGGSCENGGGPEAATEQGQNFTGQSRCRDQCGVAADQKVQTKTWLVPPGFVDVNLMMTLMELSDRIALWPETDKPSRLSVVTGAKVPWKGCAGYEGGCDPEANPQVAALHIPRTDHNALNGVYTLYDLIIGEGFLEVVAQATITICAFRLCPERRRGVYLTYRSSPLGYWKAALKGVAAMFYDPKTNVGASSQSDHKARAMDGWSWLYNSIRDRVWLSAAGALELCDASGGKPCPLFVAGQSMAGQITQLAAYDLSLLGAEGEEGGPGGRLSGLFRSRDNVIRLIRLLSSGAPRAGNDPFVETINHPAKLPDGAPHPAVAPLLRILNTGDLIPRWPSVTRGYPYDQGGVVFAVPNYLTESWARPSTVSDFVYAARCERVLKARTQCGTRDCSEDKVPYSLEFYQSFSAFHDSFNAFEPNLLQMMRMAFLRERRQAGARLLNITEEDASAIAPPCPGNEPESELLVSGVDLDGDPSGSLVSVWSEHIKQSCKARPSRHCAWAFAEDDTAERESRRCCCATEGPTNCRLMHRNQLERSWNPMRYNALVCNSSSGHHNYRKLGFAQMPSSCKFMWTSASTGEQDASPDATDDTQEDVDALLDSSRTDMFTPEDVEALMDPHRLGEVEPAAQLD